MNQSIKLRHFESESDIDLQHEMWIKATKSLPWAWKPNKQQKIFSERENFDKRSKCFAIKSDGTCVGYMSFVNGKTFIPIGYPWTHPENDTVRDTLWNHMIDILDNDFPKEKYFLQRVRAEWSKQIDFFKSKGFFISNEYPIYIFHLENIRFSDQNINQYSFNIHSGVNHELFTIVYKNKPNLQQGELENELSYIDFTDYDLCICASKNNHPIGYVALTTREDLSYSEIALFEVFGNFEQDSEVVIRKILQELRNRNIKHLSITIEEKKQIIPILEKIGFKLESKSVYVKKERI